MPSVTASNQHIATKFRQWATKHLREFIIKGFILDDDRLKNPDVPFDYFEELPFLLIPYYYKMNKLKILIIRKYFVKKIDFSYHNFKELLLRIQEQYIFCSFAYYNQNWNSVLETKEKDNLSS